MPGRGAPLFLSTPSNPHTLLLAPLCSLAHELLSTVMGGQFLGCGTQGNSGNIPCSTIGISCWPFFLIMSGYDYRVSNRWRPTKQTDLSILTLPGSTGGDHLSCLPEPRQQRRNQTRWSERERAGHAAHEADSSSDGPGFPHCPPFSSWISWPWWEGDIFPKISGPNSGCMLLAGLEKEKKVGK